MIPGRAFVQPPQYRTPVFIPPEGSRSMTSRR